MNAKILACVLLCLTFVGCEKEPPRRPQAILAHTANSYGYPVFAGDIAVPPTVFSAEELTKWESFSRDTMKMVTDTGIKRVFVSFNPDGSQINGVSINWRGERTTAHFPYPLSPAETAKFIKKATAEMNLHPIRSLL